MRNFTAFNAGVTHLKNKRRIRSLLFSLLLTLGAVPAWADDVSPHSNWNATRTNGGGTTFINMSATATTFCYLSRVGMRGNNTELAQCRVTRGNIVWTLEAGLNPGGSAEVVCSAYCYNK
jgi:hypothetical protein